MRTPKGAGVAILVSLVLVGCGSDDASPSGSSPEKPSAAPSESPSTEAANPLEGVWQTKLVSPSDGEATLRKHGLNKWIERFEPLTPIKKDTVLILEIEDGSWNLYGRTEGGTREGIDFDAEYDVDGDEVVVTHESGSTLYQWSVTGDKLTLKWLESSQPPFKGIPDEVFQRVLYMTAPFTRQT